MWICFRDHERRTVKGSYMGFADFLQVRYGQQKIDDTTREQRYYEWQEENEQLPIRPRLCNYSFEEWLKIKIGRNNLYESDREFIFNEWILDSYDVEEDYAREIGDPYSRRFDEYNKVFKNEIEHLSNEYILRLGKKGYHLDDAWENVNKTTRKSMKHGTKRHTRRTKCGELGTRRPTTIPLMLTLKLLR
ncbi:hypothetical protein Tco_1363851 [Tanacetum coccineum]